MMESNKVIYKRKYSFKRVRSKFFMLFARNFPLLTGRMRAKLFSLSGVRFEDVNSTFIGYDVYFDDSNPELIYIGKNTLITEGCRILTHFLDVNYDDFDHQYIGEIIIGKNVFMGMNCVIIKPVKIGDGAVIGANSVINKDIEPYTIWAGNPIQFIKKRIISK